MNYDFAISYAGQDTNVARQISKGIKEETNNYTVFLAKDNQELLIGKDGESFFEELFSKAKQVIVIISKHYKTKRWTRLEWDVILERNVENRFIPIRLDDSKILGLPSSIMYLSYENNRMSEIVNVCVKKLLLYEKEFGIKRLSEYEKNLDRIKYNRKGAVAEALQLVNDNRARTPLDDCKVPRYSKKPIYEIVSEPEWINIGKVRRIRVAITVPEGLYKDELRFNIKHCLATQFNLLKPDAITVFAYLEEDRSKINSIPFSAGKGIFAPFGDWSKAQDGFAYNIPTSEYDYTIDLNVTKLPDY